MTGRTRMRHKMREVRRHARADAHECCGARALRASGVGWRTEEAKEHKRDRDPGRGARAGRANMLRSVGARSALAFMPPMQTEFRNRKFGARGRSSAPCGSPPCSSPTASRPCARRAEQRFFKRERACASPLPGQDAMPVCVCVCGEAPVWIGWAKECSVRGGREGDTHRASWLFLLAFIVGSSIVWAPRARAGLRAGRASSPGSEGRLGCVCSAGIRGRRDRGAERVSTGGVRF